MNVRLSILSISNGSIPDRPLPVVGKPNSRARMRIRVFASVSEMSYTKSRKVRQSEPLPSKA